jgi:DeoR family transcriptional regulator of aga operon
LLNASTASVRRDLTRLEERGLVHRTHGGAKLAGQTNTSPFGSTPRSRSAKGALPRRSGASGWLLPSLIREHETVGFTAGTTTTQVARCIRHRSGIHVITNAVNIGMELNTRVR